MTEFLPPPGTAYEDLETPRLVIDLPAMEHNLETLHRFFRGRPTRVRSVTKGLKCPAVAQRQMTVDGAVPLGLCCQPGNLTSFLLRPRASRGHGLAGARAFSARPGVRWRGWSGARRDSSSGS